MARKDRAPTPPRRSQGPRARTTPRDSATRRRTVLYAAVGVSAGALVAVTTLFAAGGGVSADPTAALKQAGCTYNVVTAAKGRRAHQQPRREAELEHLPAVEWAPLPGPGPVGLLHRPVPLMQAVHNLEHGGIEIEWGSKVPKSQVDKIRRFYDSSPNAMLAFPLPRLGNKIALVAWTQKRGETRGQGRVAKCTRFDQTAFKAFRDAFRGKGPERFPVDLLRPGC